MFPNPPQTSPVELESDNNSTKPWFSVISEEIKKAIMTSSTKKAPGPDGLSFLIIQHAYQAIPELFHTVYSVLINQGYHPICWRQGTGAILKKEGKPDYSAPKAYRMITLLNCLGKVSEKIMATRLSYWAETTDLLYSEQMGGRKQRSAVDAAMCLTHDIQQATNNNKVLSALFLDVKGAFDHVSLNQLLKVMKRLRLPQIVLRWVQCFLTNRSITLAFDGERNQSQSVNSGIPQGSPISPMLFLIYIRFLFTKINNKHTQLKLPSYIDDVAIIVEGKTAKENSKTLELVTKTAFQWAEDNAVTFDDSKSELIHFQRGNKATFTVTLPNKTVIQPSETVRWLGVWFDTKMSFKTHVQKKIASATRTLHLLHRLMNSEWGLSMSAGKQLYSACITSISNYGSPIWWNQQKNFEKLFQKLQNSATKKILGAFRSSPSAALELESAILPPKLRLDKTSELYALRIATLSENHPIRQRTPYTYPPELETGFDIDENHYLDWNQHPNSLIKKKHPTQLIKVLYSLCKYLPDRLNLEVSTLKELNNAPWHVFSDIDIQISKADKKLATVEHLNRLENLLSTQTKSRNAILYTDGSKLEENLGAGLCYMYKDITHQQSWNLGTTMEVYDAELFGIAQSLKFGLKEVLKHQRISDIWIFSDNQAAIQRIQTTNQGSGQHLAIKCQESLQKLIEKKVTPHIHWVPGHEDIKGNELADEAAKSGARQSNSPDSERFTSISYIRRKIKAKSLENWTTHWKKATQGRYYSQFDQTPSFHIKEDLKLADRLSFATFTQMKLGHGYFKSYLHRLPDYDNKKCHETCNKAQTPEHLLTACQYFKKEQSELKNQLRKINLPYTAKVLFTTKEGIKATLLFLKKTKVATRKWLLREVEDEVEN